MAEPGRSYHDISKYRYGYNGKENDNEVKGEGNQQDYGLRIYDPRIGKFLSVDPLTKSYPELTPYQFAGNKPIKFIDLDGAEPANPPKPGGKSQKEEYLEDNRRSAASIPSKVPGAGVIKLGVGVLNFTLKTLDATTQAPLDIHQGKLDLKSVISAPITIPYEAINNIRRDPFNPAVWGENMPLLIPYTAPLIIKPTVSLNYESFAGSNTYAYSGNKFLGNYGYTKTKGLELDLNIPSYLQGKGLGSQIFTDAVQSTNATKFTATWVKSPYYATGSSINLQRFQSALKSSTAEQAAWKTWSGQQAAVHGFKSVTVKNLTNGVQATFTK